MTNTNQDRSPDSRKDLQPITRGMTSAGRGWFKNGALLVLASVVLALGWSAKAAVAQGSAGAEPEYENLSYRWELGGFAGALAGLFFPDEGNGSLVTELHEEQLLKSELRITSSQSKAEEFWLYGSVIDPAGGVTLKAWSEYLWRGREKARAADLNGKQVSDIVSGIYLLRNEPPTSRLPLVIWSDGKEYPVEVVPGRRALKPAGGQKVMARLYSIRGRDVPGGREWKGKLDLWLAEDDTATPVEITIDRKWAQVRLTLVEVSN